MGRQRWSPENGDELALALGRIRTAGIATDRDRGDLAVFTEAIAARGWHHNTEDVGPGATGRWRATVWDPGTDRMGHGWGWDRESALTFALERLLRQHGGRPR